VTACAFAETVTALVYVISVARSRGWGPALATVEMIVPAPAELLDMRAVPDTEQVGDCVLRASYPNPLDWMHTSESLRGGM
jgi:hypothetical protein